MRLGVLDIGSNTGHLLVVDAHRGAHEGRTNKGVPVYNVALPVLRTLGDTPYRVFEI